MPNSADVIAARLYEAGVRHAFGVPGGEVLTMIAALEQAGIAFVLARHENAAGFMAEGAWHATGAPGVLIATVGPGMANTVNVVANAQQDRVPLIVISGAVDDSAALSYTHQVFDHRAVLRPLVKASFEAQLNACDLMADKAVQIACDPQPGPVHIDLPITVGAAEHTTGTTSRRADLSTTVPSDASLANARMRLAQAKRPILMVGLDVVNHEGAASTLRTLAQTYKIPMITTYKAKGVLPEDHPLCLGGHGLSPKSDALILPLLAQADFVICAGYDPIEMRPGWQDPWLPENAVEFVSAPNSQFMHQVDQSWVCDPGAGVAALFDGVRPVPDWGEQISQTRDALTQAFSAPAHWGPSAALHCLNTMRPDDMVVSVDSGAHRILMSQLWQCSLPHTLIQSTGLCTMGCALPLAMGHAIADTKRSMAVMGDGCLDMIMGELATLRDTQANTICVVLNDSSLALIELKQRRDGKDNVGVDFGSSNYAQIGAAVGVDSHRVTDLASLQSTFQSALTQTGPCLIEIVIPRRAYDGLI